MALPRARMDRRRGRRITIGAGIGFAVGLLLPFAFGLFRLKVLLLLSLPGVAPFFAVAQPGDVTSGFDVALFNGIAYGIVGVGVACVWPRSKRHLEQNVCTNCGYNLTGNVSGVCPECSQKIEHDNGQHGEGV